MDFLEDKGKKLFSDMFLLLIFSDILLGPIMCLLPDWSFPLFVFILFIVAIEMIICLYWYKYVSSFDTYNKRVGYVWFYTMGFFAGLPLLRTIFNTIQFWLLLTMQIFMFVYPLIWSKFIYQSQEKKSRRSKVLLFIFVCLSLLTIVSPFIFRTGQGLLINLFWMKIQENYIRAGMLFAAGFVFMILGSSLVIENEFDEPEEKKKKRKKKKRKKRV